MDNGEWLQRAQKAIEYVELEQSFVVKDLFDGIEWSQLSRGDRLNFGRIFKNEVMRGKFHNLQYIGKANNNSAQYKKIKK